MTDDCTERADAAAYVLGALEDPERFIEHLATCAGCRAEVAELQSVVDVLAEAVEPAVASPQLRARVMASVRSEAELLNAAGARADVPPTRERRSWARRPLLSLGAGATALAAAVAVALVIALGGGSTGARQRHAILSASQSRASAVLFERGHHGELVLHGMRQAPAGQIFEVWLKRGAGAPHPTDALFGVTKTGNAAVDIPSDLRGVTEVLVTHEPLGGSPQPTSEPFLRVVA